MAWTFDRERPIYLQIESGLKQKIISGEYPPGARLPAVRDLAEEASVNPNTLQRALADLEREGFVYAHRTSGRFVTEDAERIGAARTELAEERLREFVSGMKSLGLTIEELTTMLTQEMSATTAATKPASQSETPTEEDK
jgi:DNA-binding transcriptional regulator YhcF (GntR family)